MTSIYEFTVTVLKLSEDRVVEIRKNARTNEFTAEKKQLYKGEWWTVAERKFDTFLAAEVYANNTY